MEKNKEKKLNKFVHKNDCAIHSLKEIEFFLRNLNTVCKSIKIYKFLK